MLDCDMILQLWNIERAPDWPKCTKMIAKRATHCRCRMAEFPDVEQWRAALRELKRDKWWERKFGCTWRPNIDWLVRPGNLMAWIERAETRKERETPKEPEPEPVYICCVCGCEDTDERPVHRHMAGDWNAPFERKIVCDPCFKDGRSKYLENPNQAA